MQYNFVHHKCAICIINVLMGPPGLPPWTPPWTPQGPGGEEKGIGRAGWEGGGVRRIEDDVYFDGEMGVEENRVDYRNGVTEGYRD